MTNKDIRDYAKANGVHLWRIADGLGCTDSTLSKKLRYELPDKEKERVFEVIGQIIRERREEAS